MTELSSYALLAAVGALSAALNVMAGGGSLLTLPLLIFLGLSPNVANATNRVGIVLQNVGGVWAFHRLGVLDWSSLRWAAVPATLGSAVGTALALWISDDQFRHVLAFVMIAVTLWTLFPPLPRAPRAARPGGATLAFVFFLAGVYGGFVQVGVGFLLLAATSFAGIDLVRGNAIKILATLVFASLSVAIFASQGRVDWGSGLALGLGGLLGGPIGARLSVAKGEHWVRGIVTATVLVFALKLWIDS